MSKNSYQLINIHMFIINYFYGYNKKCTYSAIPPSIFKSTPESIICPDSVNLALAIMFIN